MPLLGTEFDRIIDLKSDYAYTGYYDTAKKNRFVREAINKAINLQVESNDRITVQSNLFGIYKSEVVFTPVSNTIDLIATGSGITDYYQLMNLKAKFAMPVTGYISDATNSTPIRITVSQDTNLRTGEAVIISGVTTNTNANGTRYLRQISNTKYALYSDVNLLTPIVGNGTYQGTAGTINRIVYNYAKDFHSGRKFSRLNKAKAFTPYYEIADTVIKVYPLTLVCSEVTVDYVSLPVYIDVADSSIDLLETYSTRFIDMIADETCKLMSESLRDGGMLSTTTIELNQP